jgi:hypothetical protein
LKQVTPLRSIQPPWTTSRSLMSIGWPGHHVIPSTRWFWSSHRVARKATTLPFLSRFGLPALVSTGTGGRQASTPGPTQMSRHGVKMYTWDGG